MPGSPVGPFVGSSWRQQTMLHVETFNTSDRVALNGRSTCDERTCDRNTREPFLNRTQARLAPKLPVFELRRMRERSRKRASLTITHNNQATYQTIHFKHNNTNTWAKTVPGINSNGISPTASVENSSSRFYLISCSQGILNSSRLSCYFLLRLLVYMYLSQLMRTFTNYLKCIVISS